jgi:NTP pyrophosphatase (non-canonical NTP hydrolase)
MERIFEAIRQERNNQDLKWGEQNHSPLKWLAILIEEVGEVGKAIIENNRYQCKQELIHCAAVIVAWLECERRGKQE